MYTGEEIKEKREAISNNIVKGFSNSDDLLEKAHNQGDVHPNGKWYWESSANGGKGDWRTIKGASKAAANSKTDTNKKTDKDDNKITTGLSESNFVKVKSDDKKSSLYKDENGISVEFTKVGSFTYLKMKYKDMNIININNSPIKIGIKQSLSKCESFLKKYDVTKLNEENASNNLHIRDEINVLIKELTK